MRRKITRADALGGTLRQVRDWLLTAQCQECGLAERLPIAELIARHGAHYPVADVIEKLTCRSCGKKATSVHIVDGVVPLQKIPLV
jgi:hypothetical protein